MDHFIYLIVARGGTWIYLGNMFSYFILNLDINLFCSFETLVPVTSVKLSVRCLFDFLFCVTL